MARGKRKSKNEPRAPGRPSPFPVIRRHGEGTYGATEREQRRLTEAFGFKVSGKTHESEHAIGYEPIARGLGDPRRGGPFAFDLEKRAPAYQEVTPLHREHIGTGTRTQGDMVDKFGLTSETYRQSQRNLLKDERPSDAVQLNQMGYAFDERSAVLWGEKETGMPATDAYNKKVGGAATDSYNRMVVYRDTMDYFSEDVDGHKTVEFSYRDKLEMFVARKIVATKAYPDAPKLDSYVQEFKMLWTERLKEEWKDTVDPVTGELYSSYLSASAGASAASDPFSLKRPEEQDGLRTIKRRRNSAMLDDDARDNAEMSKMSLSASADAGAFLLKDREGLPENRMMGRGPTSGSEGSSQATSPYGHPGSPLLI